MNNPKFNILDNLSLKDIESEAEFIPLLTRSNNTNTLFKYIY